MDDATITAKLATLEAKYAALQAEVAALKAERQAPGKVLSMGQAVHKYGWSRETLRRRATAGEIPGALKRGGRWEFPA
jgi:hypothetical protein